MFSKTTKPEQTLADHPDVIAAVAKLNETKAAFTRAESELTEARTRRQEATASTNRIEDAARAFLDSDCGTATATVVTSLEAIAEMTKRRAVLGAAITEQEKRVEAARSKVGREITEAALPEYQAILRELAEVLAPACTVAAKEAAFRQRFIDQGISFAGILKPCPFNALRLDEYGSKVNMWCDEIARDHGITVKVTRKVSP